MANLHFGLWEVQILYESSRVKTSRNGEVTLVTQFYMGRDSNSADGEGALITHADDSQGLGTRWLNF